MAIEIYEYNPIISNSKHYCFKFKNFIIGPYSIKSEHSFKKTVCFKQPKYVFIENPVDETSFKKENVEIYNEIYFDFQRILELSKCFFDTPVTREFNRNICGNTNLSYWFFVSSIENKDIQINEILFEAEKSWRVIKFYF